MVGRSGAMAFLFVAGVTTAYWEEARGNPLLAAPPTNGLAGFNRRK